MDNLKIALKNLTHQIDLIKSNREAVEKNTKQNFNVFTAVLAAHDETRLHSRFITYLLNSNANHDCEKLFLKLFIDTLTEGKDALSLNEEQINALNDIKDDKVKCSEVTTEKNANGRRIDIFLEFEGQKEKYKIAIENKIYAYEQQQQIADYAEFINSSKSNNFLFYLTLDGKDSYTAKDKNTDEQVEYFSISYREHILEWLEKCLKATYKYPNINQVIQQYQNVVKQLTNQTMEEKDMEKIKEIIQKRPEIIKYQNDINNAIEALKRDFIEKTLKENISIPISVKYIKNKKGCLVIDLVTNKITIRMRLDEGNPFVVGVLETEDNKIDANIYKLLSNENCAIYHFSQKKEIGKGEGWAFYIKYDWYDILQAPKDLCNLIGDIFNQIP